MWDVRKYWTSETGVFQLCSKKGKNSEHVSRPAPDEILVNLYVFETSKFQRVLLESWSEDLQVVFRIRENKGTLAGNVPKDRVSPSPNEFLEIECSNNN